MHLEKKVEIMARMVRKEEELKQSKSKLTPQPVPIYKIPTVRPMGENLIGKNNSLKHLMYE